ncbi:MAG: reverse transcriptase-like protein [Ignavibacteria bacterium]|nr:reverse transcriptase-like protein [Ignavibacteria bacterium]
MKYNVKIWIDGACAGNPGTMGIGIVMESGMYRKEISKKMTIGTNNRAELLALIEALKELKHKEETDLVIYTDSQYVINILTKNYKARANKDLIAYAKKLLEQVGRVEFRKVTAHDGELNNERADKLAKDAINSEFQGQSTKNQINLN